MIETRAWCGPDGLTTYVGAPGDVLAVLVTDQRLRWRRMSAAMDSFTRAVGTHLVPAFERLRVSMLVALLEIRSYPFAGIDAP